MKNLLWIIILVIYFMEIIFPSEINQSIFTLEPLSAGALAAIYAGSALAGGGVSAAATGKMNRQSRLHSLRMYERQLKDQREYGSPEATMQRFKDAGLNPHLIYGQGTQSEKVPSMQPAQFNTSNPGESITQAAAGGIRAYQDDRQMTSSLNLDSQDLINKKAQEKVLNAQTLKILGDVDKTNMSNQLFAETYEHQLDAIVSKAEGIDLDNELKSQKFDLEEAKNVRSEAELMLKTEELAMKIAKTEEEIKGIKEAVRLSKTRRSQIGQDMKYQEKEWTNFENGINKQSDYIDQQMMDPDNPEWVKVGYNLLKKAGNLIEGAVGQRLKPGK